MIQQTDNPLDENGYPVYGTFRQLTKQQTAVEWLVEELKKDSYQIIFGKTFASIELIEQAKAMEKVQMEKCYNHGSLSLLDTGHGDSFEDYYNENYNK